MKFKTLLACIALAAFSSSAVGAEFPSKPIQVVVPYAPGGGTDLLIRLLQKPLEKALGQPIIVLNRSGAAGSIAAKEVARATPDGYTLLIANNGSVLVPLLQEDAGYDFRKDLSPVAIIARTPEIIIAGKDVPGNNLAEFIVNSQHSANGVSCGSSGIGSLGHLAAVEFSRMAKVKLTHVPYRGQNPTTMAVVSGELPIAFTSGSDATFEFVKSGKLKILGEGSPNASPLFPGVPPIAGTLPGYSAEVWQGIVAPAGTPASVIAKLNAAFAVAIQDPEIQKRFISLSYAATITTPAEFGKEIEAEYNRWGAIIKEEHIKAE